VIRFCWRSLGLLTPTDRYIARRRSVGRSSNDGAWQTPREAPMRRREPTGFAASVLFGRAVGRIVQGASPHAHRRTREHLAQPRILLPPPDREC
jgi:hypothetical protein